MHMYMNSVHVLVLVQYMVAFKSQLTLRKREKECFKLERSEKQKEKILLFLAFQKE